jgi:hypothetical protein
VYQFDADTIADFETFVAAFETAFNERSPDPNPSTFFGGARHDGVEAFSDARLEEKCRRRFANEPFNLVRCILALGATLRDSPSIRRSGVRRGAGESRRVGRLLECGLSTPL